MLSWKQNCDIFWLFAIWDDTELRFWCDVFFFFFFGWLGGGITLIFTCLFSHCNIPFLIHIFLMSHFTGHFTVAFLLEGNTTTEPVLSIIVLSLPKSQPQQNTRCGPCPKFCLVSSGGSCKLQSLCQMNSNVADVEGKAGKFCLSWKCYSMLHWSAVISDLPWPRAAKILRFLSYLKFETEEAEINKGTGHF